MPNTFLRVGPHWINLDLVTRVETIPHGADSLTASSVRVHFSSGKPHEFSVSSEVRIVLDWLANHAAP